MIKFGIIGTSKITDKFIKWASLVEDFKLNAVYSRTREKAEEFSLKYGVEYIFTDLDEMAKSNEIDAVYIASPNLFHESQSILFLNNKKHVLCEKPIASNRKSFSKMIEAALNNNVLLMEAMKPTCVPNFQAIKEQINNIGKVRKFVVSYCQYSSRYDAFKEGKYTNAFNKELSNGALVDIGVYCIYPMVALFGKPKEIKANGVILPNSIDGEGSILFRYDDFEGVVIYSKIANSYLNSEIQGEDGSLIIDKISSLQNITLYSRNGDILDVSTKQEYDPMYYEVKEFINLIENKRKESSMNTHKISMEVVEIMEEARKQLGIVYQDDK